MNKVGVLFLLLVFITLFGDVYSRTDKESSGSTQVANMEKDACYPYIDGLSKEIITDYAAKQHPKLIVIDKTAMKLYFFEGGRLQPGYPVPIALGIDAVNPKQQQGDGRTPEGEFYIYSKVSGHSQFTYFMGVSYPNHEDAQRGLKSSLISKKQFEEINSKIATKQRPPMDTALGGQIGIHTVLKNSTYSYGDVTCNNWTLGCIALEYRDMQKLFEQTRVATNVLIVGESLKQAARSKHH